MTAARGEAGFTLVEALIALVILSLAAVTLIGAAEAHVQRVDGVESRAIAQWAAENELAALRLEPARLSARASTVRMLGREWRVETAAAPTEDPGLLQVTVSVSEPGAETPYVTLGGFVDAGGRAG